MLFYRLTNADGSVTFGEGGVPPEGAEVLDEADYRGAVAKTSGVSLSTVVSVSSAQAKIQLRRAGLRDKVDAAVQAAGGEVLDWFTDARTWERDNPHVLDIGAGLGLKPADIDALFAAAAQIAA